MPFYDITRSPIIQPLLPEYFHKDSDALAVFSRKARCPIARDRFGYLNRFSQWDLYKDSVPFPASSCTDSLSDIIDHRAEEILSFLRKSGMEGYIFVSGGVDSTAMTYAFLSASGGDTRGLSIVYTQASIDENPKLFTFLKGTGIRLVEAPVNNLAGFQEDLLEHSCTITGWAAGHFFGSILTEDFPEYYFRDWRDWVEEDTAIGQFEEAFSFYGLPIKTFAQFAWFTGFSTKYNHSINLDVCYSGKFTGRCINFFDIPALNDWSVSNFDILHRNKETEAAGYKPELKAYIYRHNHDDIYRLEKGKTRSWKYKTSSFVPEKLRMVILESPTSCVSYFGDTALPLFERSREYTILYAEKTRKYRKDLS